MIIFGSSHAYSEFERICCAAAVIKSIAIYKAGGTCVLLSFTECYPYLIDLTDCYNC